MSVTQQTIDLASFAEEVGTSGPVAVVGGRTQWDVGGTLEVGTRLVPAPAGIAWIAVEEMTVCCGAGTHVTELDAALVERGQCVAIPDWEGATVGGVLAVGRSGIRRLGYGPVRDTLLQARFVSAEGRVIKAGGPTVKNVSGYDLCRLLVGSLGTVGLIGDVILRTRPLPMASCWFRVETAAPAAVAATLHRPSSVLWDGTTAWILLEGHPDDIEAQCTAAALREAAGPPALPPHRWSVSPSELSALTGTFVAEVGVGVVHHADPPPPRPVDPVVAELTARVRGAFDPTRRLNPGRDGARTVKLGVVDDELAACVACGLCLPHCPTYRVTGEEAASPRGRIAAMREVHWEGAEPGAAFVSFMDACVQCRGCETACPSSVPFGRLMEGTRDSLAAAGRFTPWWQRLGMKTLGHHGLLMVGSRVLAVAQRAHVVPKRVAARLGVPRLPIRPEPLEPTGNDVWLFTGCVMDAWMRPVHAAVVRVLGRAGFGVALPGRGSDCCGALHMHAGLTDDTKRLARHVIGSMPGTAPILVDSAGCGAALKDYGHLLNTPEAEGFSARVYDVHEWLAEHMDALPCPLTPSARRVAVQDPCHLRHVQRAHLPVRTVLQPYVHVVELDDEGLCCGAGGAYSALHPEMAGAIRERKVASIGRAAADVVASANPGCALHLAAAGVSIRHPMEILDEALDGR